MRTFWPGLILAALLAVLAGSAPAAAQTDQTFTLQPAGQATITFIAFCTEFGDKYPDELELPGDIAEPEVRVALQYIADNGLADDTDQALQGQYAIWTLLGQPAPAGDDLARQVVSFAQANTISDPPATSLLDAASSDQVTLSLQSWEPAGPVIQITDAAEDHFYGRGELLVENVSDQALDLYMPVGTLFPPTVQPHQVMAGYLSEVRVENPVVPLPETSGGGTLLAMLFALAIGLVAVRATLWRRRRRIWIR